MSEHLAALNYPTAEDANLDQSKKAQWPPSLRFGDTHPALLCTGAGALKSGMTLRHFAQKCYSVYAL
jgi:hypothetical protein